MPNAHLIGNDVDFVIGPSFSLATAPGALENSSCVKRRPGSAGTGLARCGHEMDKTPFTLLERLRMPHYAGASTRFAAMFWEALWSGSQEFPWR
jgi:hypothetical protein